MPTYEYHCTECNHSLEERQKITDSPLMTCPACSKPSLKRGVGGGLATFRFLGDGFYLTDYKNEKKECSASSSCCPCKDKGS